MSKRLLLYADFKKFTQEIDKNSDIPEKIAKLEREIENGRFCKFEKMGAESFYKFRTGNHRLIAHKYVPHEKHHQDVEVYVLLNCFARRDNKYIKTPERQRRQQGRLEDFNSQAHHEPFQLWLTTKLDEPVQEIPTPNADEQAVLAQCRQQTNNIWILETPDWISQMNQRKFSRRAFKIKDAIENLMVSCIDKESQVDLWCEHETKIIYYFTNEGKFEGKLFLLHIFLKDEDENLTQTIREYTETIKQRENLDSIARRAYPEYILNDFDLWMEIQEDQHANLALSPEERGILDGVLDIGRSGKRFPLFINGRPGSGKSTILQYLYAEYFKSAYQHKRPLPLLLTYSEPLCNSARESVSTLIIRNAEMLTQNTTNAKIEHVRHEIESHLQKSIRSYRDFLIDILPEKERRNLQPSNYVGYTQFKKWLEPILRGAKFKGLTVELCWHVIRSYIKGMGGAEGSFDQSDYEDYPMSRRTISIDVFERIYTSVWEKYKTFLSENNLWDDQDLTALVLALDPDRITDVPAVFCDEAQDFTKQELEFLFQLSTFSHRNLHSHQLPNVPFIFAGDPFQTLNPTGFNWDVVKADFYEQIRDGLTRGDSNLSLEFNFRELQYNYRSAPRIVQFCNVIQLHRGLTLHKYDLVPQEIYFHEESPIPTYFDIASATLPMQEKNNQGINILLPCPEGAEKEYWTQDGDLKDLIGTVEKASGKPVFSPMSAKGLEFPRIVLYKFGNHALQNKRLFNILIGETESLTQEDLLPASYFFNSLYVAASRAKKRVLIVDTQEAIQQFWKPLFADPNRLQTTIEAYRAQQDKKDDFKWSFETHMSTIQRGSEDDWTKNREDLEKMAEQYFEKGMFAEDRELMEKAARTYGMMGSTFKQNLSKGYWHYFSSPPDYKQAGTYLKGGRDKDKLKAVECFWKSTEFASILEVDPDITGNRIEYHLANFILNQDGMQNSIELLENLLEWSQEQKNELTICVREKAWGAVVHKLQRNIRLAFDNSDISLDEWKQMADLIDTLVDLEMLTYSVDLLKPHYKVNRFDDIAGFWEKVPNKPQSDAYPKWLNIVFAEIRSYPTKLEHLDHLNEWGKIRQEYLADQEGDKEPRILSAKQAKVVAKAFLKVDNIEETFQVLKKHNSVALATFILEQPMYKDGKNQGLATVAAQRLFERYIVENAYKKASQLVNRGKVRREYVKDGFDVFDRNRLKTFAIRYLAFIKQKDIDNTNSKAPLQKMWDKLKKVGHSPLLRGLALERITAISDLHEVIEYYETVSNDAKLEQYEQFMQRIVYILNLQLRLADSHGKSPEYIEELTRKLDLYRQKAKLSAEQVDQVTESAYQHTIEYQQSKGISWFLYYSIDYKQFDGWDPKPVVVETPLSSNKMPAQRDSQSKKQNPSLASMKPPSPTQNTVQQDDTKAHKSEPLSDLTEQTKESEPSTDQPIAPEQALHSEATKIDTNLHQENPLQPTNVQTANKQPESNTVQPNTDSKQQMSVKEKKENKVRTPSPDTIKAKAVAASRQSDRLPTKLIEQTLQHNTKQLNTKQLNTKSNPLASILTTSAVTQYTPGSSDHVSAQTRSRKSKNSDVAISPTKSKKQQINTQSKSMTDDTHSLKHTSLEATPAPFKGNPRKTLGNPVELKDLDIHTNTTQSDVALSPAEPVVEVLDNTNHTDTDFSSSNKKHYEYAQETFSGEVKTLKTQITDLKETLRTQVEIQTEQAQAIEQAIQNLKQNQPVAQPTTDISLDDIRQTISNAIAESLVDVHAKLTELELKQTTLRPSTSVIKETEILESLQSHMTQWQEDFGNELLSKIEQSPQHIQIESKQVNHEPITTPNESVQMPACPVGLFDEHNQFHLTLQGDDFEFTLLGEDDRRALTIMHCTQKREMVKLYLNPTVPGTLRSMEWDIERLSSGTYWIDMWQLGIRRAVYGELVIVELYNNMSPNSPAIFSFSV